MPLARIITDPIISTENVTFTPFRSQPPVENLPLASRVTLPSERDPLLHIPQPKKQFFRARPLWLVPFALIASITRGMTLVSRVEVFIELSCRRLHDNQTSILDVQSAYAFVQPQIDASPNFTYLHLPYVPPPAHSSGEFKGGGVSEGDVPHVIPGKRCSSYPAVQTGAAKLQTIMTTTVGALSALTTSWWIHFGERYGRTRVLAISTLGLILTDLIFILVSMPRNPLAAHSHKLLILAPIVEGLLGGWSSLTSANTAYIADCVPRGSRATISARFTGMLFVGLAFGPILGAWLIKNPIPFFKVGKANHSSQSVNSVFWVAICGSLVNLLLVLFVLPESLPSFRLVTNRKGKNRAIEGDEIGTNNDQTCVVVRIVKGFISPLAEFLPADVPVTPSTWMPGQPYTRKDWSLSFLALSLFVHTLSSGLFQLKYLFTEHIYNWAAEQLSYYISFIGALRTLHLLVVLPFLLTTFKPIRVGVSSAVSVQLNTNGHTAKSTKSHVSSEIRFDLLVLRCSMLVDLCSHALIVLLPLPSYGATTRWSQLVFVGATSLTCAGAGVIPAAQSLTLCILQGRKMAKREEIGSGPQRDLAEQDPEPESGELSGAISVIQAVGQTILGPILFGVIYSSTVASLPRAIFATAGVIIIVAIILTMFVRPDTSLSVLKSGQRKRRSAVASKQRVKERRGRSRVKKDLRGGSASASYGAMVHYEGISGAKTEAGISWHA